MDLLKIFEQNEEIKKEEERVENEKNEHHEIKQIISEIIVGAERHLTDNEDLLKKIGIKYKKNKDITPWLEFSCSFEYNKSNVKKIQKYLNDEMEME